MNLAKTPYFPSPICILAWTHSFPCHSLHSCMSNNIPLTFCRAESVHVAQNLFCSGSPLGHITSQITDSNLLVSHLSHRLFLVNSMLRQWRERQKILASLAENGLLCWKLKRLFVARANFSVRKCQPNRFLSQIPQTLFWKLQAKMFWSCNYKSSNRK